MRAKLEAAARQLGKTIQELEDLIDLPESMMYVWKYFIELHNARSLGNGISPISYSDIQAYFNLYSIIPMEWEIQVIKQLDNIAMQAYAADAEKAVAQAKQAKQAQKTK